MNNDNGLGNFLGPFAKKHRFLVGAGVFYSFGGPAER